MCTLTYIPLKEGDYIFTTNRDEDPRRTALPPEHHLINNGISLYPKDEAGSGTWMLCNSNYSVCLLNGAFIKHKHEPPYAKSRGLVVIEYANYSNTVDFILNYKFDGIEPFTMIVLTNTNHVKLEEIRWDGSSIHYKHLNARLPLIWSSSTLYSEEIKLMRLSWFSDWLENKHFSPINVLEFHKSAGKGDEYNGLIMNRKELVKTTSITQIIKDGKDLRMRYEDLKKNLITEKNLRKEKSLI